MQGHGIASLKIAELQKIPAVDIVEALLGVAVIRTYLLHRRVVHVGIVLPCLISREAVVRVIELTQHTVHDRCTVEGLAQTVLRQCRRAGMGIPGIQRRPRQHIAERQCELCLVDTGHTGARDIAQSHLSRCLRFLGVDVVFHRHQHIHERRGAGDRVGVRRGLHAHTLEEIRAVSVRRR